jgi:hypothetical protein
MSERIDVKALVGPACVAGSAGIKVKTQVEAAFTRGSTVVLDFSGVTTLTTSFLNQAVGALREHASKADLEAKLSVSGLDKLDAQLYRLVMIGADRFYAGKDPRST